VIWSVSSRVVTLVLRAQLLSCDMPATDVGLDAIDMPCCPTCVAHDVFG
jgi:hypothetical protein